VVVHSSVITCVAAKALESHVMKDSTGDNEDGEKHCLSPVVFHRLQWLAACFAVGLLVGVVVGAVVAPVCSVLFVLHLRREESS
jgi:hypothetical protein